MVDPASSCPRRAQGSPLSPNALRASFSRQTRAESPDVSGSSQSPRGGPGRVEFGMSFGPSDRPNGSSDLIGDHYRDLGRAPPQALPAQCTRRPTHGPPPKVPGSPGGSLTTALGYERRSEVQSYGTTGERLGSLAPRPMADVRGPLTVSWRGSRPRPPSPHGRSPIQQRSLPHRSSRAPCSSPGGPGDSPMGLGPQRTVRS